MFKLVVLSSVLALAATAPSGLVGPWGLGWGGLGHHGLGASWAGAAPWAGAALAAPLVAAPAVAHVAHGGVAAAPAIAAYNYRGPLSLAPGQPANILAHDGRPLDTISVNLDRAAHLTARAVDHAAAAHHLGKRSAPLLGAAWSHAARIDVPAARIVAPAALALPVAAPLALHGVAPGVGAWGHGAWGHGAWGHSAAHLW